MIPEDEAYPYFSIEAGYKSFEKNAPKTVIVVVCMRSHDLDGIRELAQNILDGKLNHPQLLDNRVPNWIRIAEVAKYHFPWPNDDV